MRRSGLRRRLPNPRTARAASKGRRRKAAAFCAELARLPPFPDSEPGMQADINEVVKVCRLTLAQQRTLFNKEESAAKFDLYLNHLEYQVDKDVCLFPD